MRIGLFEDSGWRDLWPLTRLRRIGELWWGLDTLAHKWARYYRWEVVGYWPAPDRPFSQPVVPPGSLCWINARLLPGSEELARWLSDLRPDTLYVTAQGEPVAFRTAQTTPSEEGYPFSLGGPTAPVPPEVPLVWIRQVTDFFQLTGSVIQTDWKYWRHRSAPLPSSVSVRGRENVFLHPTARVGFVCIDAEAGPVWIGPAAELQDGVLLQHTNAIGPHVTLLLGAKVRTHNSFGPFCKIGGEVGQSTFFGYSNKAHDGFVGHSVIGTWCNLGAGSNTSNLKNTYGPVQLYHVASGELRSTGLQFCGLIMGDYARCGIQTPFTTGCVVDLFANVVGTGFTPKYIPAFYWGPGEFWQLDKALEAAARMRQRRGLPLPDSEAALLRYWWTQLAAPSP